MPSLQQHQAKYQTKNIFMQQDKQWAQPTNESIRDTQLHQQQKSEIMMQNIEKRQQEVKKQAINSAAI